MTITLASSSPTRVAMLLAAGVPVVTEPARIDEDAIRNSMQAEDATPRDVADALAEYKARKIAAKVSGLVLGADQVLACDGQVLAKAESREALADQLRFLRNKEHRLYSAAVIYEGQNPVWRHVSEARLTMRMFSDDYLSDYIDRNWPDVASCVGGYKIEGEGVRLFSRIDGDHFTILGLPLLPLLGYLAIRGIIEA